MDELQAKIDKLPTWAREHIRRLEERVEPNNEEIRRANRRAEYAEAKARKASEQLEAVHQIMLFAARGGSETAKAYVERVLKEFECDEKFIPIRSDHEEKASAVEQPECPTCDCRSNRDPCPNCGHVKTGPET